jgi:hypothetical protein
MKRLPALLLLVFLLLFASSCLLFKPSPEKMTRKALKAHPRYDVVIVPGIQFREPAWDRVLQMRLIWAKHLYDRGLTKNIITSGSAVYTPYVEAKIMAEYLVAMGVPREHVFVEDKAEHSTENVWYGYKLAKKLSFRSIAVCSDPFQSKMVYGFTKRRTHREVKFLPAIIDTLQGLPHDTPVIDYQALRLNSFTPITEKYTKWQRLRGTLGKNINFKKED